MDYIILHGHLAGDAEKKQKSNGSKYIQLSLLANYSRKEPTKWNLILYGESKWKRIFPYLTKGTAVVVKGGLTETTTRTNINGKLVPRLTITVEDMTLPPFDSTLPPFKEPEIEPSPIENDNNKDYKDFNDEAKDEDSSNVISRLYRKFKQG